MSRLADVYAKVSPRLAHAPGSSAATKAHAWVLRKSGGRIGRRMLGGEVLVLRTRGRKSGQVREAPMFFLREAAGFAVVASNAASTRPPAWYLNLLADPDVVATVGGRDHPVRARRASDEEVTQLWPRFVELYRGYDHYKAIATRELPVVVLEPRG